MKVRITHLKAPWPPGAVVGDVLEFEDVRPWALGKFEPAGDDAEVTLSPEGRPALAGPTADQVADAERAAAAEKAAAEGPEDAALDAQKAAARREELLAEAEGLKLRVQPKWSIERLAAEVEKAKASLAAT